MMVTPGPVVRLPFLRIVAATPLPVAGEHHRVGLLYSHSARTTNVIVSCLTNMPGDKTLGPRHNMNRNYTITRIYRYNRQYIIRYVLLGRYTIYY